MFIEYASERSDHGGPSCPKIISVPESLDPHGLATVSHQPVASRRHANDQLARGRQALRSWNW